MNLYEVRYDNTTCVGMFIVTANSSEDALIIAQAHITDPKMRTATWTCRELKMVQNCRLAGFEMHYRC